MSGKQTDLEGSKLEVEENRGNQKSNNLCCGNVQSPCIRNNGGKI